MTLPETASAAHPRASATAARRLGGGDAEDAELVRRIARRDGEAFEALYRRYAPRLGRYLWKVLGRPELAEEALNDVLLVVWQKADTFLPGARFSTWVFGIAHNKARKALSRLPREASWEPEGDDAAEDDGGLGPGTVGGAADPEQLLMRQDLRQQLDRALAVLSPEHRAVVDLAFTQGFSYPEIAAIVGCPVNTVTTRTFHARKRLLRALAGVDLPGRSAAAPSAAAEERASS
jgi:RNA polymerase sigma factor (sigma-70 family)